MPAPASTRDAERAQIENIAKARGMQPWETQALIEALASARRGMGNLQLQQERLRWQLRQNGVDPILMDLGAKLLQGDLRAAQAVPPTQLVNAARELTGPAPSNRTQLAGRSADFMQDQRADTFEYQQPDLNRPRPRSTPSAVPPMLDRNRAPFFVRRPDGSFEFDPTAGQPAPAEGFTGPEAPPITARRPPVIGPSMQLEQRDALYRELNNAIQGRIAPAPDNLASSMGDAYVVEQMIPALRERYADRPDVLARLDEITAWVTQPDPLTGAIESAYDGAKSRLLPTWMQTGESARIGPVPPMILGNDRVGPNDPPTEWGEPIDHTKRLRVVPPIKPAPAPPGPVNGPRPPPGWYMGPDGVPISPAEAAKIAPPGPWKVEPMPPNGMLTGDAWGLTGPPTRDPLVGAPRVPPPGRQPWHTGELMSPQESRREYGRASREFERGIKLLDAPEMAESPAGRTLQRGMEAPEIPPRWKPASVAEDLAGPPPAPPGGKAGGGAPGTPGTGGRAPTPRGGGAAVGMIGAEMLMDRYGSAKLTNEQLRQLLLIARGQYPAGGMTAQPAR